MSQSDTGAWIFQANPEQFDVTAALKSSSYVQWSIRQQHLAPRIKPGHPVFIWRAKGKSKSDWGIVAIGEVTDLPSMRPDDAVSFWAPGVVPKSALRVGVAVVHRTSYREPIVSAPLLREDPVLARMDILTRRVGTNFHLKGLKAARLLKLCEQAGVDWTESEWTAALWSYGRSEGAAGRSGGESPAAEVSQRIVRLVSDVRDHMQVYRQMDPRHQSNGPSAPDAASTVWDRYFAKDRMALDSDRLQVDFDRLFPSGAVEIGEQTQSEPTSGPLRTVANDDPNCRREVRIRLRIYQAAFRQNLMQLYQDACAICGHGPAEVLQASHIVDHATSGLNAMGNGLLLRSDLHQLFDANLLRIDPDDLTVHLDRSLRGSPYWQHHGATLRPRVDGSEPDRDLLRKRWGRVDRAGV